MTTTIELPKKLVEKLKERGLDPTTHIVDTLVRELELDPVEEAETRIELAEKYLEEARKYIERGDAVQASEKMYKVVEECIKALAHMHKLPEYEKAVKEGRWWTQLLGKAARKLAKLLNEPRIESTWSIAYDIHVWGFHEAKYTVEDIAQDIQHIEWLLNHTKKQIKTTTKHQSNNNSIKKQREQKQQRAERENPHDTSESKSRDTRNKEASNSNSTSRYRSNTNTHRQRSSRRDRSQVHRKKNQTSSSRRTRTTQRTSYSG